MVLGRIDDEVKINGVRIQLSEINSLIVSHPAINTSTVLVHKNSSGNNELLAFVVCKKNHEINTEALNDFLGNHLPVVMLPKQFYFLNALPLLSNGKIDKRRLLDEHLFDENNGIFVPDNEIELKTLEICQLLLGKDKLDLTHSFFALGGTSLLLLALITRVRQLFSIELSLQEALKNNSIRSLSQVISVKMIEEEDAFVPDFLQSKLEPVRMTQQSWVHIIKSNPTAKIRLFCFHYAGGNAYMFNSWANYLSDMIEVYAIQLPGRMNLLDIPAHTRLDDLIPDLLAQVQPYLQNQPYAFLGYSVGGLIAYNLTHALASQNQVLPEALFIAACRAPTIESRTHILHNLPDEQFIEGLKIYGGTPAEVLTNHDLMHFMLPILRADFSLFETYKRLAVVEPLSCPIYTYGGLQDKQATVEELKFWQKETTKYNSLKLFPGDHFFIKNNQSNFLMALQEDISMLLGELGKTQN